MIKEFPFDLPDTPYSLWVSGELNDHLPLPEDFRAEIVNGEITVSPAPVVGHNRIVYAIHFAFTEARVLNRQYPWIVDTGSGTDLVGVGDGYIPDLIVLDSQICAEAEAAQVALWVADQVELAVEVTSKSNAAQDRKARPGGRQTKWSGYARAEVPYYLLVDRDPKVARTTLYSVPDAATGAYLQEEVWEFGKPVVLPEHFGVTIPTDNWRPWGAGSDRADGR
ncbi:Uma2 family endonuclease [Actinocorallia sp. API 0066]|uniref:Uma2 family endonuclease n=1 Tax=Actinocorallia sp. API 0066 TaxID=2896846 RepID=UPI001E64331D|nr:Uma2 family endonuclease [Actinocorallia sp. API 0066]MCD0447923.1 Uma2 family endonuclease [Actinocorallia sp. API 0066]